MENNDGKSTSISIGGGFFGLLTIAFIVLKLCKVIDWSWLWVLSPIWIPLALVLVIGGIIFLVVVIKDKKENKKYNSTGE